MRRPTARLLLLALLALTAGALFAAPGRGTWLVDPDSAAYVGLARSLAAGEGYTLQGEPHRKFPPGFPFALALVIRAAGDPEAFGPMRDLVCAASVLAVWLTYLLGRRLFCFGRGSSLLLAFFFAASVFTHQYAVAFLRSEPAFTVPFLGGLLAAQSALRRCRTARAAGAGLLLGAAALVRTAGVTTTPAVALGGALATRRARPWLLLLLCGLAPPAAFAVRNALVAPADAPGYVEEFFSAYALDRTKDVDVDMPRIDAAGMARRIGANAAVLAASLGKFLVNDNAGANLATDPRSRRLRPGGLLLLAWLLLGLAVAWRRGAHIAVLAAVAYVATFLVWPFDQQQRFYLPLLPILLALLGLAAVEAVRRLARLHQRPLGFAALVLVAAAATAGAASVRSDRAEILGRWSPKWALLVAGLAAATGVLVAARFVRVIRRLPPERLARRVLLGAAGLFVLLHAAQAFRFHRALRAEHRAFLESRALHPVPERFARLKGIPELFEMLATLLEHARPGDVVMSDIPKIVHVTTGLRAVPFRFSSVRLEVYPEHQGRPVRFLYFSREIPQASAAFDAFVRRNAQRLRPLYQARVAEETADVPIALYELLPE